MNIFLIGENYELTVQLASELNNITPDKIFVFDRANTEISKSKIDPAVIIIVSDYNETWGWWLVTELYFQFPKTINILVQVRENGSYHKKISEKLHLIVADEKIISGEVSGLLKETFRADTQKFFL